MSFSSSLSSFPFAFFSSSSSFSPSFSFFLSSFTSCSFFTSSIFFSESPMSFSSSSHPISPTKFDALLISLSKLNLLSPFLPILFFFVFFFDLLFFFNFPLLLDTFLVDSPSLILITSFSSFKLSSSFSKINSSFSFPLFFKFKIFKILFISFSGINFKRFSLTKLFNSNAK
uniref:Uncharacterized protein n=1 Tax=Meloidogyne enterolobii TaxID=390850 RepID=A0A6V7YBJ9_MELEN|nr:unnamed protein product [Meloidogyne enterolobii]